MLQRQKAKSGRRTPVQRRKAGPKQQEQGPISLEEALESRTPTLDMVMGNGPKKLDSNGPPKDGDGDADANDDNGQNKGKPVRRVDDEDEDLDDPEDEKDSRLRKTKGSLGVLDGVGMTGSAGGTTALGIREMRIMANGSGKAVKKDVGHLAKKVTSKIPTGGLKVGAGAVGMLLAAKHARAGSKRMGKAADANDAGGMTLGKEQRDEGLRDMPGNLAELGSGVTQNLGSSAKNHKLGHLANQLGSATQGLGIATHAIHGAQGMYQMGKAGQRGLRMLDVKSGAGGGIKTPRGGAWYRRIANRNAWKAALQGLKILGAALGIAGLLAAGPFGLIAGLLGAGLALGRYATRKKQVASSKQIQNPNAIEKQDAKAKDEQKPKDDQKADGKGGKEKKADDVQIEAQVDEEIDDQLGDEDHPPKKVGFFTRLFKRDPASKKRRAEEKARKNEQKALRAERKAALKVDKRKLEEARRKRVKELKQLRANKKGFDKSTKKARNLEDKIEKYKKKGKSTKDLEQSLKQHKLDADAFKQAGFPPEDAAKHIENAKDVVKKNREVAFEMVNAMQATKAPNPEGTLAEKEHHDSELLTGDVLDLTRREVLSASGQELIEKKMSAWDGM